MLTVPDEMYVSTFQATGCPNPNPDINWWKTIQSGQVFQDMMNYCTLVKDGNANENQISHCCGTVTCVPTSCMKQKVWKQGKICFFTNNE